MGQIVFNIALGRVRELYNRVKSDDPGNSALILVPLETSGLESDAVLKDKDTLADVLAGATNEQTTMGRKTLTQAELAALPAPDDTADTVSLALPTTIWSAASGNGISKIAVCYDPDTTAGTDSSIVPLTAFDFVQVPSGSDIEMTGGTFYTAS